MGRIALVYPNLLLAPPTGLPSAPSADVLSIPLFNAVHSTTVLATTVIHTSNFYD